MPRPRIAAVWQRRIRELVANDPQGRKSARQIWLELKRIGPLTVGGERHQVPGEATVRRYVKDLRQAPPATLAPYREYSWPRSHLGEGALPWSEARAAAELHWRRLADWEDEEPLPNEVVTWYARLRAALPGPLPAVEVRRLRMLAAAIALRQEAAPVQEDPDASEWLGHYLALPTTQAEYEAGRMTRLRRVRACRQGALIMPHGEVFLGNDFTLADMIFLAPDVTEARDIAGGLALYFASFPCAVDPRRVPPEAVLRGVMHGVLMAGLVRSAWQGAPEDRERWVDLFASEENDEVREMVRRALTRPDEEGTPVILSDATPIDRMCLCRTKRAREAVTILFDLEPSLGRERAKQALLRRITPELEALAKSGGEGDAEEA